MQRNCTERKAATAYIRRHIRNAPGNGLRICARTLPCEQSTLHRPLTADARRA